MAEQLLSDVAFGAPPAAPEPAGRPLDEEVRGLPDPHGPRHRVAPARLWKAVLRARAELAHERHLNPRGLEPSARVALVAALEAYVKSLTERGHPVPYTLRDELRLQRLTCVTSRGYRPMTSREGSRVVIEFAENQGTYAGTSPDGRRWTINPVLTGWRLEFRDQGDAATTCAGVHASVQAAQAEAAR
jgi:hypothetical protein